jgi:hypothetical protein
MNLFQKFCALFGAEFAVIFVKDSSSWHVQTQATVRKVRKLAAGIWVIARCQTLLKPGGGSGDDHVRWKPVTKEVSKFYNSEVVKGE